MSLARRLAALERGRAVARALARERAARAHEDAVQTACERLTDTELRALVDASEAAAAGMPLTPEMEQAVVRYTEVLAQVRAEQVPPLPPRRRRRTARRGRSGARSPW